MGAPVTRTVKVFIDQAAALHDAQKLEKQIERIERAIKKGNDAGKDMTKELEKLGQLRSKLEEVGKIIDGKMAPPIRTVRAYVRQLRNELEGMSADAPGYAAKFREFEKASGQLHKMEEAINRVRRAQDASDKASNFWSGVRGFAMGTIVGNTVQMALEKTTQYITGMVTGNAKLSDSLADVRKATGLTTREVEQLNSSLSRIDTRTLNTQLREIAIGLGQLGQEATTQAIANIDKIVVALGDEFGENATEITKALGILRNNLQDIKTGDYGADMLHIGNALNVLGAEGMATAPVITDIANRISGVAESFGASAGQILGFAATMQELGIETERGSTAFIRILQKMTTNVKDYAEVAKFAGVSQKEFTDLVNSDIVAALQKVAEGAKKAGDNNLTFGRILKDLDADGSGAGEVLSKLASNGELLTEKIKLATQALKEENSITEEFNTKNNTLAATLEKIEKRMTAAFTNSSATSGLKQIVELFAEWVGAIDPVERAINALREQQSVVKQLEQDVVPLIETIETLTEKANELGGESKLSADEQAQLQKAITSVGDSVPYAIEQMDQYGRVLAVSAQKARDYIEVQKAVVKERNREAIKEAKETLQEVEGELRHAEGVVFDFSKAIEAAIKDGTKMPQSYYDNLDKFTRKVMELRQRVMGLKGTINQLSGEPLLGGDDKPTLEIPLPPGMTLAEYNKMLKGETGEKKKKAVYDPIDDKAAEKAAKKLQDIRDLIEKYNAQVEAMAADAEAGNLNRDAREIAAVKQKYAEALKMAVGHAKEVAQLSELQKKELDLLMAKQATARQKKEYDDSLKELDNYYSKQRQKVGEEYTSGTITRQAYNNAITKLDVDQSQDRAQIAERYATTVVKAAEDTERLKTAALEKGIAQRDKLEKQSDAERLHAAERRALTATKYTEQELQARIDLINEYFEVETRDLDRNSEAFRLAEERRDMAILDAKKAFYQNLIDIATSAIGSITNTFASFFSYLNAQDNAALDRDRKINDERKRIFKEQLDNKQITEKEYNRRVEKADAELKAKENQARRKEFNRNKSLNLINAAMDGAKAITGIWAAYGTNPILAGILTAIAATANGIQLGIIARQKFPEYAKGRRPLGKGGIPEGASHSNGGISLINADGTKVGEMEGDEAILSKDTVRNNPEVVNRLLDASMNRNGQRIDWLNNSLPRLNVPSIAQGMAFTRMFGLGGIATAKPGNGNGYNAYDTNKSVANGNITTQDVLQLLYDELSGGIRAHVVYNDVKKASDTIAELRSISSIR